MPPTGSRRPGTKENQPDVTCFTKGLTELP
jgi:hypothetical protein